MSRNNICVNLFQNKRGEICAFASYDEDGKAHGKLIENIEKFAKTPDAMFDYLLDGFSGFSDYDSFKFDGEDIDSVLVEREEDEGYELIVHFEFNGISTDYYFDKMNDWAQSLFRDMKNITDQKELEFEKNPY